MKESGVRSQKSEWGLAITLFCLLTSVSCLLSSAAVVDRIAVIVGKDVITESEVLRDVRVTEFLNGQPLDLGPQARRTAANRLVDQQLIRNEMEIGHYAQPPVSEADAMLARFQREHYASMAELRAALVKYGLTEDELKQFFLWQAAVVRFTEQRFLPSVSAPPQAPNEAERSTEKAPASPSAGQSFESFGDSQRNPQSTAVSKPVPETSQSSTDQQLDTWLKEARANTRVEFKPEAFQ